MAHKTPLKKATKDNQGGYTWTWNGQHGIKHVIHWAPNGTTHWRIYDGNTLLREEQPWPLVRVRGEVQENVNYYRHTGLDLIAANRAMLSCGLHPNQHTDAPWCNCGPCTGI